jgi:hypothetical protein
MTHPGVQPSDPEARFVIRWVHRGQPLEGGEGFGITSGIGGLDGFCVGENRRRLGRLGGGTQGEQGDEQN